VVVVVVVCGLVVVVVRAGGGGSTYLRVWAWGEAYVKYVGGDAKEKHIPMYKGYLFHGNLMRLMRIWVEMGILIGNDGKLGKVRARKSIV
jgi:hypothetical protein